MNKYIGKICPYCKSPLVESDEIVVCTDCEMPHHKECWIENKGCTTFGCQGTIQGIEFETETNISSAPKYDVRDAEGGSFNMPEFCSNCGNKLYEGNMFCSACGAPVNFNAGNSSENHAEQSGFNTGASSMGAPFSQFQTNNFMDAELETYIGENKEYYVNQFEKLKKNSTYTAWNWSAFLVPPYWCIFRKMYIYGGVLVAINFILSLIGGVFGIILSIGISVAAGLLGNYMYMHDLEQRVAKGKNYTDIEKQNFVSQQGGTNMTAAILTLIICALISIIISFQ